MSNLSPAASRPQKTMSNRLLTMKFMQRAAASTAPSTPQSVSIPGSQVQGADTPPSKRRKTVLKSPASTPAFTPELQRIRAALDEEEAKREKAMKRLAEEAGETKWVLSTVDGDTEDGNGSSGEWGGNLNILQAGYAEIDSENLIPAEVGRRTFGKFNKESEKRRNDDTADQSVSENSQSSSEDGEVDDEDSDDPAGTRDLIRETKEEALRHAKAERKAKRRAEKAELARLAEKRKSKQVKLNRLSSISGGGGPASKGGGEKMGKECFACGQKGHEKRDCPQRRKHKGEDGSSGGRPKKPRASLDY